MDRASIFGNYRAKVVDNKDKQKFGRVLVWIPDLMPEVPDTEGIWARPANNPLGGRNMENSDEHHYMGTSYIPKNGAWLFVFFEGGNINRPYYFGALDLENTKVLPENQLGSNYEDKWTIFKSHEGRVIVVSDDPDDARIEIGGKKREMTEPPTGDTASVYKIDDNMTTILFDERDGKEKILIRSHKGDFIHFDIDERKIQIQIEDDVEIECKNNFYLTVDEDINILSKYGDIYLEAESGGLYVNTGTDLITSAGGHHSELTQQNHILGAVGSMHRIAGQTINHDAGGIKYEQSGTAQPAKVPDPATEATPEGTRDT